MAGDRPPTLGLTQFDPTQTTLVSFPAQLKKLQTKRTRAFTSFKNVAANGKTGAGGYATLLDCEQALQGLTVTSSILEDTLVEIGCRFSSTGNREMMPATAEKIEENIAEIANYLK